MNRTGSTKRRKQNQNARQSGRDPDNGRYSTSVRQSWRTSAANSTPKGFCSVRLSRRANRPQSNRSEQSIMPTVTEILRLKIRERGAYKAAKETGLQYRTLREFLNGDIVPNGRAIDALAEYFGMELTAKIEPKKPKAGRTARTKPRK
jgi:ribosome-binding protein aMBF1 (putative translation factor)